MKRFSWPLQRLLDVTAQRELSLRAELFALSRAISGVHQEVVFRRSVLAGLLSDLAGAELAARLAQQMVFFRHAAVEERRIGAFVERLEALRVDRRAKTQELHKVRSSRETLEKLREQARRRHARALTREEQKQLDDSAAVAFARAMRAPA